MFAAGAAQTLLNVSYDPTRELYQEYNAAFAKYREKKTGGKITLQAIARWDLALRSRVVIDGLKADVVTLALAYDIDAIADKAKAFCRPIGRGVCPIKQHALYVDDRVSSFTRATPSASRMWEATWRSPACRSLRPT